MVAALATAFALAPKTPTRLFLGVERSVCGRAWRDRLDERGDGARARHRAAARRAGTAGARARRPRRRGRRGRGLPRSDRAAADARSAHASPAWSRRRQRLADAIERGEQVAIFGDYDVDGATSSALLARFLRDRRHSSRSSISPTGSSKATARTSRRSARSPSAARRCSSPSIAAPPASSRSPRRGGSASTSSSSITIRPTRRCRDAMRGQSEPARRSVGARPSRRRRPRVHRPWSRSTACCARAVSGREARPEPDLLGWLDLVALGTVADVVPLKGLNRAFVAKGLLALRRRDNVGLTALMDVARLSGPPEPWHLGFLLGPRINAGGRIGRADLGVGCCCAPTIRSRPARIAAELDRLNRERQAIEVATLAEAEAEAHGRARHRGEGRGGGDRRGEGWHPGVVGLVAARLKERFSRPAFAIALEPGGIGTGSGRSIAGVDLGQTRAPRGRPRACCSRAAATPWRRASPCKHDALAAFRAYLEERAGARRSPRRGADQALLIDGAVSAAGANAALVETDRARRAVRRRQSGAGGGAARSHASPMPMRSARPRARAAALGRRHDAQRHRVPRRRPAARPGADARAAARPCMPPARCRSTAGTAASACRCG